MTEDHEPMAFSLRLGAHRPPVGPPDVEAFCGRVAPDSYAPAAEEVGVLGGAHNDAGPMLLFVQRVDYPIPGCGARPTPNLDDWALRPVLFGSMVALQPALRAAAPRRVAWIAAACLPLVWPTQATAAPEATPVEVQRPTPQRPVVPKLPEDVAATPEAEPGAETDGVAEPDPGASDPGTSDPGEPDPATDDGLPQALPPEDSAPAHARIDPNTDDWSNFKPPPPPNPFTDATASDRAAQDAAWQGVDDEEVVLELKGGKRLRGRVGAVQRESFTLIEHETGVVIVLPKSGVRSLRVYKPAPVPTDPGSGMLIGGSVLTAVATPVFVSGIAFLAVCPSCVGLNVSLLVIGGGGLAGGIPMIVFGSRRRREYRKALREHQISATVTRSRQGWSGGLRFRF